ncbi:MAG: 3-oxoacyl-ACP reductase FabG [Clostridia bacterium]|nr:3-oxoacyl-ACP reductase FabG [Clostridia bacterium]
MLKGKNAIITGASRGIGAAIAKLFAENGANVAIIYSGNEEKANEVLTYINENTEVNAGIFKCNVANLEECQNTVKEITEKIGKPDILVNNAGITRDNLILTMTEDEFDDVIDTNLKGAFNMIKSTARGFVRQKSGKIINVSSVSGLNGIAGQANYSSSKAGLIGLTKSVAKELGGKNICCNAIAPGFVTTDMTKDMDAEAFLTSIPLKRVANPLDIANTALFLASSMSDYVTGETIRVDGGLAI